jgi:radical SAM protein with 4Fe4S-binding SPASM domain
VSLRFDERPILVFWEATRACPLACRHCRAEALHHPLPGELSTAEGFHLIDEITRFGRPHPVLILTGGDCLQRPDLEVLVAHARDRGVPVALSPSVSPSLSRGRMAAMRELGVRTVSVSLDGASPATHERTRGVEGHLGQTMEAIALLRSLGFTVQVNTTVMAGNVAEIAGIAALLTAAGVAVWEVFFLIAVGRGAAREALTAAECEDVCHLLIDVAQRGMLVRTVEGPFFRRVAVARRDRPAAFGETGPLYRRLAARLQTLLGPGGPSARPGHGEGRAARSPSPDPGSPSELQDGASPARLRREHRGGGSTTAATRDGSGLIFVAHDGAILPSGFLPLPLGNVRRESLVDVYRESPLLRDIRAARFAGRCGRCPYRRLCGGSRARAFAASGDPLGEDPACSYLPPVGPEAAAPLAEAGA